MSKQKSSLLPTESGILYHLIPLAFTIYKSIQSQMTIKYQIVMIYCVVAILAMILLNYDFKKRLNVSSYMPNSIKNLVYIPILVIASGAFALYIFFYEGIWMLVKMFVSDSIQYSTLLLFFRILIIGYGFELVKRVQLVQRLSVNVFKEMGLLDGITNNK